MATTLPRGPHNLSREEVTRSQRNRLIRAMAEALAGEPAFARLFMIEVYSAGDEVLERRAEIQRRFADLVSEAFGARDTGERFACEALVASIAAMVTARLAANDIEGLRALRSG